MSVLKTWRIHEIGWERYFAEVSALSKGRLDVRIIARKPGIISLIEKERKNDDV